MKLIISRPLFFSPVHLSHSKLNITEYTSDGSDDERDVTFNPENLASSESSSSEQSFLTADPASRRASTVEASGPKTPHNSMFTEKMEYAYVVVGSI